jgi:hypothetical protein
MLAVYDGEPSRCIGFILPRGRQGIEALTTDLKTLGIFQTPQAARDAVSRAASHRRNP